MGSFFIEFNGDDIWLEGLDRMFDFFDTLLSDMGCSQEEIRHGFECGKEGYKGCGGNWLENWICLRQKNI